VTVPVAALPPTTVAGFKASEHRWRAISLALESASRDEPLMPGCHKLMTNVYAELRDLDRATWAARSAILTEKQLGQYTAVSKSMEAWLKSHPAKGKVAYIANRIIIEILPLVLPESRW
jgi:hypothetical protein